MFERLKQHPGGCYEIMNSWDSTKPKAKNESNIVTMLEPDQEEIIAA